jgi:hypothetical protein
VPSQTIDGQVVTTGRPRQAPELQKVWERLELSAAHELAQTVVSGRFSHPVAPQVWQAGQAAAQQNPFAQPPTKH